MIIDVLLLVTFLAITLAAAWLFARRQTSYTRWIYIGHAFGFALLAIGTLPGLNAATMLGVVVNIIALGLGLAGKFLVEIHQENGMDIRTGKLTN